MGCDTFLYSESPLARCAILRVSGYDSREIYDIAACRRFFGNLPYRWDGWLHFLEKRTLMAPLFALLVQVW